MILTIFQSVKMGLEAKIFTRDLMRTSITFNTNQREEDLVRI
jgi:hypothetical protein